ncbi:MAG: Aldehyde oxidase, partial [Trebouxia sp. A1-2]
MFALNGQRQWIGDVAPSTVLYDFLRTSTPYTGTKNGCGEGGCGSCSVQVHELDDESGQLKTRCINACLCPVGSLDGCSVVTVEGLGNAQIGFNAVQERIAGFHGSQCGFCTPGMVVACHTALSIAHSKGESCSAAQMEKAFDGNLCRCTGYRPILDACKSLTAGVDLEDLGMHCMDKKMQEHKDISVPKDIVFPAWLRDYNQGKQGDLIKAEALRPSGPTQTWLAPKSLSSLLQEMRTVRGGGQSVRLVGGNTGPGVYKDWPVDIDVLIGTTSVKELTGITNREEGLFIGAAVTQSTLIDYLLEAASKPLKQRKHQSNVEVSVASILHWHIIFNASQATRWLTILDLLDEKVVPMGCLGTSDIVTSIHIPAIKPTHFFWSFKVAQRHFNAHAFVNMAMLLDVDQTGSDGHKGLHVQAAHVSFGFDQMKGDKAEWQLQQGEHVEQALQSHKASMDTIGHAVAAVSQDVKPGQMPDAEFLVAAAEGILFEGLASLLHQGLPTDSLLPKFVLEVDSIHDVPPSRGKQVVPNFRRPGGALGEAFGKERALLQASGEAIYTLDQPQSKEGLWACYVASQHPLARFDGVDTSAAMQLPGVMAYISADDIPKGGINSALGQEPVFAEGLVEWVGQPIGLLVAANRAAAERGAQLVKVNYTFPEELGTPILQISEARKAKAYHKIAPGMDHQSTLKEGQSMEGVLKGCQHQIRGGRWTMPSQLHFYMEPQTALAQGDGEGGMEVWSSSQSPHSIMQGTAMVLGLPQSRCTARCRRMGGAFGGKTTRSVVPAAAVAVAANKLKRQVRMSVNRGQDLRMNGGRARIELEYDVGFDDSGKIQALDLHLFLLGGIIMGGSTVDVMSLAGMLDQAYAIPAYQFDIKLCKTNRPPHSAVRAPGKFESPLIMEHIIEHVAARLNLDPVAVRELNFLKPPPSGPEEGIVTMTLGSTMPASLYTLPRLWDQLKTEAQYTKRLAQVNQFNKSSVWLKRGISITPCRFKALLHGATGPRPALISLYPDGTVLVTCAGTEMGQGLFTKVKQVALHELSKCLPEPQRPMPAHLVEVADNNTSALPNTGMDAGSTTAEGACESVRLACQQLVQNTLAPTAANLQEEVHNQNSAEATWKAIMKAASNPMAFPNKQLTAYALFDGSRRDKPAGEEKLMYSSFGASCSEVEINMLTGERRAEGGFVYALGMLLQEDVTYDAKGQPEFDSTWTYKIPSAACVPREMIIRMLENSPNKVGIMTSKSTGEPPLLASVSVITAFQAAITAAKQGLSDLQASGLKRGAESAHTNGGTESVREQVLRQLEAPVTVKEVKRVIGDLHLSQLLLTHQHGGAVVVPDVRAIKVRILKDLHNSAYAGHVGGFRTVKNVQRLYWWPRMQDDLKTPHSLN